MKPRTVEFSKDAANVFFHILTQCNLACRHCNINPDQHGCGMLPIATIRKWLAVLAERRPAANVVFLGGEPTLHPDLADAVIEARRLGYASITIDTNGYLFHDILDRVTPAEVDFFSFSLDGPEASVNDALRGTGSFAACTAGIQKAVARGFRTSLIYTVSRRNIDHLDRMPPLLKSWGIERFFIQVIGIRGRSAGSGMRCGDQGPQLTRTQWETTVPPVAAAAARLGIVVTYPKVYLSPPDRFECAGRVADNYFVFPNGRVYRCPLCEDFPVNGLVLDGDCLVPAPRLNETDLFSLDIAEGCVMNRLIQPENLDYDEDGSPRHRIACCLLKEELGAPPK